MARVWGPLASVVSAGQAAFLPGCGISDNVQLLQLLPDLLRLRGHDGFVTFRDFFKAYDAVDWGFIAAVLERLGSGAGFLAWVQCRWARRGHVPW